MSHEKMQILSKMKLKMISEMLLNFIMDFYIYEKTVHFFNIYVIFLWENFSLTFFLNESIFGSVSATLLKSGLCCYFQGGASLADFLMGSW